MPALPDVTAVVPADGAGAPPELLRGPSAQAAAQNRTRTDRASVRAALLAGNLDDEPADDAEEAPAAKPVPKAEAEPDAETSKRLAKVAAEEKRSRERITGERKELEAARAAAAKERADLAAERAELEAFRKAKARVKVDPTAVLEAMGVTDAADLDYVARAAYTKAKGDPTNKAAQAEMIRTREASDAVADLQRQVAEMKAERLAEREGASAARDAGAYVDTLKKHATAGKIEVDGETVDAPLARHFLAKNPVGTEKRLRQTVLELLEETGDRPDHADVLTRYERNRRAELLADGIDPDSLIAASSAAAKPKTTDQPAPKKPGARTLANDLSTPRVPRRSTDDRDQRAETRKLLEQEKLE